MTVAPLNQQKGGTQPRGRPDKKVNADGTVRSWFESDPFECGKSGHKRLECPIYKALLAKDNWNRPQGHKETFDKARDEFHEAYA